MKKCPPLHLRKSYFDPIEGEVNRLFKRVLFIPLAGAIGSPEIVNAIDPLATAIRTGRVWFSDGVFYGDFNARISKRLRDIGAVFRPGTRTWRMISSLPPDISMANAAAAQAYAERKDAVLHTLGRIDLSTIDKISAIPDQYMRSIQLMESDFRRSVKNITIAPDLPPERLGYIAAEWGYNLDLYVKDWIAQDIVDLRQKVMENTFSGSRASALEDTIRQNYGVSQRKARFLARQETSLLKATYNESRYKDLGSQEYIWSGTMDGRERHDHRRLEGKRFSWDNPPVTNLKTGAKNNPGKDYGCRCVPIAIVS